MLYGYPVRMPEMAPAVSGAGKGFIVFGDLRGFIIGERLTNISLFVDPYSKSTSYQTLFLLFTRWAYAHALPQYYGRIATHA
jgi:HK97 family phage major capsid protein